MKLSGALLFIATALLVLGCLNPTASPTPEPTSVIVVPPATPSPAANKLSGLDFLGLGRAGIAASCIATDTDEKTGVTEHIPLIIQGGDTRLDLTQSSQGKNVTIIMIISKTQVLLGGSYITSAGTQKTAPNADACQWVKVDVPKGTDVSGADVNPAADALAALRKLPAKDFDCHPTVVTGDTFRPSGKTCTTDEYRAQLTPTLPSVPWPNGATTVMELAQSGKPYECSQRAAITGPQGLEGHVIIFIYGTRAKETFRANINNALYDDDASFVDGATLYSQVGKGTPACHWATQYQPTINGQTMQSFGDFVSTITPDSFTCVLSHINGIPLPRPGDPCPV